MSELKKVGFCSVDGCSCCGSDRVCRIKPEYGEGDFNSGCSRWFLTVLALEKNREVPCRVSVADLANKFVACSGGSVPVVLSVNSGLSDSQLWESYKNNDDDFGSALTSLRSPSATVDFVGGRYGNIELVGRGLHPTNPSCGKFRHSMACLHNELHHNTLAGNYEGKAYVKLVHSWCHNPRCPICFKHGFAVREARSASERIKVASKTSGSPAEHIIYSVSPKDYGLSFEKLREKARKDLMAVGVVGGALIFHGFRFRNHKESVIKKVPYGWTWAPHWHCVGFLLLGYSHCRNCKKVKASSYGKPCESVCEGCSGFENKVRNYGREHGGVIIKIADSGRARKSVMGTLYYQLHHASLDASKKRFHVLTWFGSCGYHKLKVEHQKHSDLCPLCKNELVKVRYFGSEVIVTDFNSFSFKRELFLDAFEDGKSVFAVIEDEKPNFG